MAPNWTFLILGVEDAWRTRPACVCRRPATPQEDRRAPPCRIPTAGPTPIDDCCSSLNHLMASPELVFDRFIVCLCHLARATCDVATCHVCFRSPGSHGRRDRRSSGSLRSASAAPARCPGNRRPRRCASVPAGRARDVVEAASRAVVPAEVLHRPDDFAVLDQEQPVARHAGVEQRQLRRPRRMYQKKLISSPRLRRLDHLIDRRRRRRPSRGSCCGSSA